MSPTRFRTTGGRALAVPTDVSDPDGVARLVARTLEAYGRLDAAFNNAAGGGRPPTPLAEIPVEDYDRALGINLRGVFLAMKYEIPPCSRAEAAPSSICPRRRA